ncbi:hypothetical protein [Dokdonella soli]|uniref:Uncharacterized protein n=1 Tax=Dokdonella soli TaxID=529810 RepID=A0ABP3TYN0_9GAMM
MHQGFPNTNPDRSLAAALRALPDAAPQPDLWPELARVLGERRRPQAWRYAVPVALAAGLALAMLVPRSAIRPTAPETTPAVAITTPPPNTPAPASATAPGTDELAGLHQRSQSLERWIAAFAAHAPQDSRDLMAAIEVEDLIGLVDVQLAAARDNNDALPLWRQRVALLEDLATIRSNAFAVAANDESVARGSSHLLN